MVEIGAIVWGVEDIDRATNFWKKALDYEVKYSNHSDWAILIPKNRQGFQLSLSKVTSLKAKRHHMDLFTDNKEEEVKRLIGLGAKLKPWNYEKDADYTVLIDTEGNSFCIVQK